MSLFSGISNKHCLLHIKGQTGCPNNKKRDWDLGLTRVPWNFNKAFFRRRQENHENQLGNSKPNKQGYYPSHEGVSLTEQQSTYTLIRCN